MWAGCLFGYCEPVDRRARKGARDDKMVGKRNDQRFNPLLFSLFTLQSSLFHLLVHCIATGFAIAMTNRKMS
jgi:hypothetical protein